MAANLEIFEGNFPGHDGLELHYRYYKNSEAQDTLLILHGHGEHIGRYQKFPTNLADKRLNIATFDARGHGTSGGLPVYINSYEDYINDVSSFVGFLEKQFALPSKFFLLGHSNGGLVAIHWAVRCPERLKALFLSAPFLGLRLPPALVAMNAIIHRFKPSFVYQNPVYPPYLTHNTEELAAYKQDTLIRRKITARLITEMMTYQKRLEAMPTIEFPFPVYILMAGLEKVVDPLKTHLFYQKLKVPAKEIKTFGGFYHEIFNELGQEQVFEALRGFMDAARALPPPEVRG